MRKEYEFSQGTGGPVIRQAGESRITIGIDDDILEESDGALMRPAVDTRRR